jgi:hypothetical protein
MKKLIPTVFILLLLCSTIFIFGCHDTNTLENKTSVDPPQVTEEIKDSAESIETLAISDSEPSYNIEKNVEEVSNNSFLGKIINSKTRPIAVMIDNDNSDAWPHAGIEDAYLIYEIIVEGGSTRLMALFKDTDTEKIGPVRSSRHYFLDYTMENDALYVHFGWSPKAAKNIESFKINNVNGVLGSDEWIFWREPKYKYDYHDAYTSIDNINEILKNKGYRLDSDVFNFNVYPNESFFENGINAEKITIPYSKYHTTYYEYDSDAKMYLRWMRKIPHISSTSNKQLSAKNIIIQSVKNYYLNDGEPKKGRQELDTVGQGSGYYITNGKAINITWEKKTRNSKTYYYDDNKNEIKLNDGQTWIQVVPTSSNIIIQ